MVRVLEVEGNVVKVRLIDSTKQEVLGQHDGQGYVSVDVD
jgi:hypothetical protein